MSPQPTRLIPTADHRNFDLDQPKLPERGPTFELGGEEFHCVPCPAGQTLARLYSSARINDRGQQVFDAPNMQIFIEDVLAEFLPVDVSVPPPDDAPEGTEATIVTEMQPCDDIARWRALMADKARPIHISVIGNVLVWLSGWYTDRPTEPSGQ